MLAAPAGWPRPHRRAPPPGRPAAANRADRGAAPEDRKRSEPVGVPAPGLVLPWRSLKTEVVDLPLPPERDRSGDVLWALVVYVVALFGIPSALVLAPLGAAGSPGQIVGMVMCAWWAASQLLPVRGPVRRTPVHWLLLVFVVAVLASYVAGMSRPLFSGLEVNSADRGLLALFAWCGVALVISEGLTSGERLRTFLRTLAIGAAPSWRCSAACSSSSASTWPATSRSPA